jgi:hypothetical protein
MSDFMTKAKKRTQYTRTVPIVMDGDLVAEFEELERQLAEALQKPASDSLEDGSSAQAIAELIEQLREQMKESTHVFVIKALLGKDYRELKALHPPRQGEDGDILDEDRFLGANVETFLVPLLKACCADPVIDDEVWAEIENLSDRQYDELINTAITVNRGRVDIPFSRAASAVMASSSPE